MLEFQLAHGDLPVLRELLSRFAVEKHISCEDYGDKMPPKQGRRVFWLHLASGQQLRIEALNIRREDLISVWIYRPESDSKSEQIAKSLVQLLRMEWPDLKVEELNLPKH